MTISRKIIEKLGLPLSSNVKMAIIFDNDNSICTFFPKNNVPYYNFKYTGNCKSPFIANKALAKKFFDNYNIPRGCIIADFELTPIQHIDGMMMYAISYKEENNGE